LKSSDGSADSRKNSIASQSERYDISEQLSKSDSISKFPEDGKETVKVSIGKSIKKKMNSLSLRSKNKKTPADKIFESTEEKQPENSKPHKESFQKSTKTMTKSPSSKSKDSGSASAQSKKIDELMVQVENLMKENEKLTKQRDNALEELDNLQEKVFSYLGGTTVPGMRPNKPFVN
jgi:hypothetical protein